MLRRPPRFESFNNVVRVFEVTEAAGKASEHPPSYTAGVAVGDPTPPLFMAPHSAGVAKRAKRAAPVDNGTSSKDSVH